MRLYIAEKPSLGRAIADVLPKPHEKGDGYIRVATGDVVSWCVGHLLEQAEPDAYDDIEAALTEKGIETASAEITMVPDNTVKLSGADAERMQNLEDALDENDDVQNVYSNYEMVD